MAARALARQMAYVPQSHTPIFGYTVLDMVLMGATSKAGLLRSPGGKERKMASEMLERVGIAGLAGRDYTKISGGERQLALIARALTQQAGILVMDEPTANLDYGNQLRILGQIQQLAQSGYSVILSTHHPEQAFLYAGRMLALLDGKVLRCGTPEEQLDSELIEQLYGVQVDIEKLREGSVRVCIPRAVHRRAQDHK
jgi:iron complex transport system ATP-binding protein